MLNKAWHAISSGQLDAETFMLLNEAFKKFDDFT